MGLPLEDIGRPLGPSRDACFPLADAGLRPLDDTGLRPFDTGLPLADMGLPLADTGLPPTAVGCLVLVTCTPAQHFTGRGLFDRFKSLWSSWAVEDVTTGRKAWFGGDTGYRTVLNGEDEDSLPVCPEFKRIGEVFGGFDLALIPIGCVVRLFLFSTPSSC